MPETEVTEPSMSDLRAMLAPEPDADISTEATPAPVKTEKPAPASEPVVKAGTERNTDGTFKPAAEPVIVETPGVAKRIGAALAKARAAEERAEAAEAALLAKPGSQPVQETAQPVVAKKPESKDFDTYEAFNEALVDFKMAQTAAARVKTDAEQAATDLAVAAGLAWNERVAKVATDVHADYEDVMAEAADMPISRAMNETIFESERGPEVAYFLAKHPDECARIEKLKPFAAARELGKIEAALDAPAAVPAKPAVKPLPKPARAVGGSAAPHVIDLNDENLSPEVFASEFRKRIKAV